MVEGVDYVMLKLLGKDLSVDMDLSTLPCGENGALYLSEMDATGGRSGVNTGAPTTGPATATTSALCKPG